MTVSCLHVDFNEMLEPDLVLLPQTDEVVDRKGNIVQLYEGLFISLYSEDSDEQGNPDNLTAEGWVEMNNFQHPWGQAAKWCCRINHQGIRHESDIISD